jgi:hypothetical protein
MKRIRGGLVARYLEAVAPGSYLALSQGTYDKIPPNMLQAGREARANVTEKVHLRSKAEVERFFDGLELVPPYTGADRVITYAGLWAPRTSRPLILGGRVASTVVSPAARDRWLPSEGEPVNAKPTVAELGIDLGAQDWQRSGDGDGALEIAFVGPAPGTGTDWVLMRVAGDPDGRVLVYDRNEWECFLDGVRAGEFDDAAH